MWSRDWRPAAPTFPPGVNICVHHAASFLLSLSRFQVYDTIISHEKQQGGAGGYNQVGGAAQVSRVIHYIANSFSIIRSPGLIHHLDTKNHETEWRPRPSLESTWWCRVQPRIGIQPRVQPRLFLQSRLQPGIQFQPGVKSRL